MNSLFGETWRIAEFGSTNSQLEFERCRKIKAQRLALDYPLGALVAGYKKDVVLTNRLSKNLKRLAIYGWHRLTGRLIQPLSTVHGARYADYSHGIRLVSDVVLLDGESWSIYEVLQHPRLVKVLSQEGVIRNLYQLMGVEFSGG